MADAVQTSYTKETYFQGMATIADFASQGYEVVGYNTVLDPTSSEPTWYVLMVKRGKKGFDIVVDAPGMMFMSDSILHPLAPNPNPPINAVGKRLE